MSEKTNPEKVIAVLIVAAAFLFVAYSEFSDSLSGATMYRNQINKNEGWANCRDSDEVNDVTVQGKVTVSRWNTDTDMYEPLAPYIDECIGPSRVREWECSAYERPIALERNTFCPENTICSDGACV